MRFLIKGFLLDDSDDACFSYDARWRDFCFSIRISGFLYYDACMREGA